MDRSDSRNEVRSFLIGTLFGDCHVTSTFQWQWSNTTRDWVEWKAAYVRANLGFPCNVSENVDLSCRNERMYKFTAAQSRGRLKIYRNWFYDKFGTKRITNKIRFLDHPIGLMALIIDQGSCRGGITRDSKTGNLYYRKPTTRIHLNKHSKQELELFQESLKVNFNLESSLQKKPGGYLDVYFGTSASQKLWALIKDLIPNIPTAKKKFHPFISQTTNSYLVQRKRGVDLN